MSTRLINEEMWKLKVLDSKLMWDARELVVVDVLDVVLWQLISSSVGVAFCLHDNQPLLIYSSKEACNMHFLNEEYFTDRS
jgi:hypothetical protein